MSIDLQQLASFRLGMEADDFFLNVEMANGGAVATVAAGPSACGECLVPKETMRMMLAPMLGVVPERIQVVYPVDVHSEGE